MSNVIPLRAYKTIAARQSTPTRYYAALAGLITANALIVLFAFAGAWALFTGTAFAAATPTATATQIGPRTFILDASASPCKWRYCAFAWRAYGPGYNRLGGTAGYDATLVWIAPQAGSYNLTVTESEFCNPVAGGSNRTCPGTASVFVRAA